MSIYTKLLSIQTSVTTIAKTGKNTFHKYTYVTLNDILDGIRPHLTSLGLVLFQSTTSQKTDMVFDESGTWYSKAEVHVETILVDSETNEQISVGSVGFSVDKAGDKAAFKAETGARKYGLLKLFALDTAEAEPEADEHEQHKPHQSEVPKRRLGGRTF